MTWFFVLNIGAVTAIVFGLLYYFVGQRNFFQERSERLLLNILPKDVSETLKREQRTIATHHAAASILFADVVDFTPMAASMTPLELVDLLNEVFHCFDGLVDRYGVEKIKTIGDCYMVAAGVPAERADHAACPGRPRARHAGGDRLRGPSAAAGSPSASASIRGRWWRA